jgi:hypothetical protein
MAIRLIDVETRHLKWCMGSKIPEYAILSHTWEEGEISFQEMEAIRQDASIPAARKPGYVKVVAACQKAADYGIRYVWIDTCCIDKTSSSELSEAINSMYQWYQKARVCFAFLADLHAEPGSLDTDLQRCRWFTRGWCLQELLAPRKVDFFDASWNPIGSKADLTTLISKITRIDEQVLIDSSLIHSIPAARRMSWAASRETTREEDIAYCLLGIFDVNMPMLYGEGPRAFIRLQEEIIKASNDLSIFAFSSSSKSEELPSNLELGVEGNALSTYRSLFASSPTDFANCGDVVETETNSRWNDAFVLTNKGLYFRRAKLEADLVHGSYSMLLNCRSLESGMVAKMILRKVGPGLFARYEDCAAFDSTRATPAGPKTDAREDKMAIDVEEAYIITKVTLALQTQLARADEHAIHVSSQHHQLCRALQVIQRASASERWDVARMQFLTKGEILFTGYWKFFPSLAQKLSSAPNHDREPPSGHCYAVCGVEHNGDGTSNTRTWVRLYSLEEWKSLETRFGIITQSNNKASPLNNGSQSDRLTMKGKGSTNPITITATIQPVHKDTKEQYQLNLELKFEITSNPSIIPAEEVAMVKPNTETDVENNNSQADKIKRTCWSFFDCFSREA